MRDIEVVGVAAVAVEAPIEVEDACHSVPLTDSGLPQLGRKPTAQTSAERVSECQAILLSGRPDERRLAAPTTAGISRFSNSDIGLSKLVEATRAISRDEAVGLSGPLRPGLLGAGAPWLAMKRVLDIIGSLIGWMVLLPVFIAATIAILINSPGPVFFVQERLGLNGRPFKMVKFRSMYAGADEDKAHLLSLNECRGPVFKIRNNPRMTSVGLLLRKLSIDELPQLINVLHGDMSLVGPRPPVKEEYDRYGSRERERLRVKPGLTGLWQVSGRSLLDFDACVRLDLEYILTWTLWLDLKILFRTIPAVLTGRGAY